ncbi:ABC transporter substrate-binding protein [Kitasatospora cinereorecta]
MGNGRRRPVRAVAAAAVLALLAGCSGAASAGGGGDYTVMTWAPSGTGSADRPGVTALAEAIGRTTDAKGGLGGHHLRVLTCNEHNTADGATACARQAADAHAVAVIGSYSEFGENFMPVLEQAGIPYIGGYGMSGPEFSSPYSYPVAGGTPTLIAGSGRQLVAAGCKQIALVRPDTRAGDTLNRYLASSLGDSGVRLVDLKVPDKDPDYPAIARKAVGDDQKGNCVSNALSPEGSRKLLEAYRQTAPRRTQLSSVIGAVQQSVLASVTGGSGSLNGSLATGWYPPESSRVWDDLRAAAGGDTRIDLSDLGVQTTWVAYQVFLVAVDRIQSAGTPLTAKTLRSQLDSGDSLDTGGATPPLNWGMTDMLPSAESPRLVNTWVTFQQIRDGRLTEQQSGFVDVRWVLTGGRPPQ